MQSQGGAPVTGAETPVPQGGSRLVLLLSTAAVVLVLDQVAKYIAVRSLTGRRLTVVDGVLWLRLVRNPGAAFGLGGGMTVVLALVAIVVAVVILRTARRLRSVGWALALALLLGGALGNLTDRLLRAPGLLRGHVVDFVELPRWPVFNVADMAIVCAALLIGLLTVTGRQPDGRRSTGAEDAPDG